MRSKVRTPISQNLSNIEHKPARPAELAALAAQAESRSKVRAYGTCNCRSCRRYRKADRMEPLTGRDEAWVYSFLVAGAGLWALLLWAVL
jgi:hypothetical protein